MLYECIKYCSLDGALSFYSMNMERSQKRAKDFSRMEFSNFNHLLATMVQKGFLLESLTFLYMQGSVETKKQNSF